MKLNKLHNALVLLLCATTVACNKNTPVQNGTDQSGKTPITLSIGGVDSQSSVTKTAVITDDPGKTYRPFDKDTKIFMVMKSTYDTSNPDFLGSRKDKYTVSRGLVTAGQTNVRFEGGSNQKYWDDAHARSSQLDIWAFAQQVSWDNYTFQVPDPAWPGTETDPYKLNEYKDNTFYGTTTYFPWWEHTVGVDLGSKGPVYPCIMVWKVTNTPWTQTATSIQYQDLMFSNNLTKHGDDPADDKRLKFNNTTPGKFDGGEMKFYHAMSKITINIIEGDGFIKEGAGKDSDFQFKAGTNIKFHEGAINTQGTFNIKNGYFEKVDNHNEIASIALTTLKGADPEPYYTLQALAIPNINGINGQTDEFSRFVLNDSKVMMEFTIDNSTYKISSNDLYASLHGKDGATEATTGIIPLEAGKNYVFTFKVSKTKVSGITAQVADWEEVTAENINPSNARITLSLDGRGDPKTSDVAFYRALDTATSIDDEYESYAWAKAYEKSSNAQYESPQWKTEWYWPSNMSFYHFRAVSPVPSSNLANDATYGDYFILSSSDATSESYNEIAWGAPFYDKSSAPFSYSTSKGFDGTGAEAAEEASRTHQISKAIGPTDSQIKLLMFHMMSGVHFTIKTSDGSKNDQVELYNESATNKRPKVQIVGYYPSGKVFIGDGHVVADGAKTTTSVAGIACRTTATEQYGSQDYYYSAVPQTLSGATSSDPGVQLYITAPDNNQYIVNLKDILATTVSGTNIANPYQQVSTTNGTRYKIDRWYPGFQYNYTLKLTKKGIEDITATIVNWETVTADEEVQIQ